MEQNLDPILIQIKKRYSELKNSCDKESFVQHLLSLARWNKEPMDYPNLIEIKFPKIIHIAHAVCHPECGVQEFIVDGSTQSCQKCGGLMFRGEIEEYLKK